MQITYFPYMALGDVPELKFEQLGVTVWNYSKKADDYISDPEVRATLDAIMESNIKFKFPIKDMGILSIGESDFRDYSASEKRLAQEVRTIIFTASIAAAGILDRGPNTGHSMISSENFTLLEQQFTPGMQFIGVKDGFVNPMLHGGYKVGEITFRAPEFVNFPLRARRDSELIIGLLKARQRSKRLYRRIMRASETVMQAYYNDTKMGVQPRILTMATAYEILFDLPDGKRKREDLRKKFEKYFRESGDPLLTYITHADRSNRFYTNTSIKTYWAHTFFGLRNAIIHGDLIDDEKYDFRGVQSHFSISILFFVLGVKKLLEESGIMEASMDEIKWATYMVPDYDLERGIEIESPITGFRYDSGEIRKMFKDVLDKKF